MSIAEGRHETYIECEGVSNKSRNRPGMTPLGRCPHSFWVVCTWDHGTREYLGTRGRTWEHQRTPQVRPRSECDCSHSQESDLFSLSQQFKFGQYCGKYLIQEMQKSHLKNLISLFFVRHLLNTSPYTFRTTARSERRI